MPQRRHRHVVYRSSEDGTRFLEADCKAEMSRSGVGASAGANIFRVKQETSPGWEMDLKTLGAGAAADVGVTGAALRAGVHVVDADVGAFSAKLGIGADTVAKYDRQDRTVEAKVLGTGIKIGKKCGLSVLNNELTVDLGKVTSLFRNRD